MHNFKKKPKPPYNNDLVNEACAWYMEHVVGTPVTYACVRNNPPWWDYKNKTKQDINWQSMLNWKAVKTPGKGIGLKGNTNKENYFARKYIDHLQPGNLLAIVDILFHLHQEENIIMRTSDKNLLTDIEKVFYGKPNNIIIPNHIDLPNNNQCRVKWNAMMLLLDTIDRIQFKQIAEKYSNKNLITI